MKRILQYLWALSILLGCNYRYDKVEMPAGMAPTFDSVKKYVIEPKCLSCHFGAGSPMGVDLSSYDAIMAGKQVTASLPESSPLYTSIVSGRMPKGQQRLSEAQINLVREWIQSGALMSATNPEPEVPEPTFDWIQTNVLSIRCIGCHNGKNPKTEVNFTNYEAFIEQSGEFLKVVEPGDAESSGIYISVSEGTMPPKGGKLSDVQIEMIKEWINKGAKK